MKKLLSAVICFCILTGAVLIWIPEISASVDDPQRFSVAEKKELIYSENFEGASVIAASNKNDLTTALGWTDIKSFSSFELRQDPGSDNHQLYLAPNSESITTVCTDDRLKGGNYMIEYTATMLTFEKSHHGAGMGFRSGNFDRANSPTTAGWNFLLKERGNFDFYFHTPGISYGNYHSEVDVAPAPKTIGGVDRPEGSVVGETIRFRLVIDEECGLSAYIIDQATGNATIVVGMNEDRVSDWVKSCYTVDNTVQLRAITAGTSYLIDDIQIWDTGTTDSVPQVLGYQITPLANDTYDIRFIAGIRTVASPLTGFEIRYSFLRNGEAVSGSEIFYCDVLYEEISTDFGKSSISAEALGYTYLLVLPLTDIPSDLVVHYTVRSFTQYDGDAEFTASKRTRMFCIDKSSPQFSPELLGGTLISTKEFSRGFIRKYYENTTRAEFDSYLQRLEAYGYVPYAKNTADNNVYCTYYYNHERMIHAYYLDADQTVRVISSSADDAVPYPLSPVSDETVTTPALVMADMDYEHQLSGHNRGMGFVFTLADGSYVIIDGGYGTEAEPLYRYLSENNRRADGKIRIRAWILTHPDGDHYECFLKFADLYAEQVQLDYWVAQVSTELIFNTHMDSIDPLFAPDDPDRPTYTPGKSQIFDGAPIVRALDKAIAKFENVLRIVPMTGQTMYFGDLKMQFVYTGEMLYPREVGRASTTNEHSLVMKVWFEERTLLITGDVLHKGMEVMVNYYEKALRSDFIQAPHHGLQGTMNFYNKVDARYLIMNTDEVSCADRFKADFNQRKSRNDLYKLITKTRANGEKQILHVFLADNSANGFIPILRGNELRLN